MIKPQTCPICDRELVPDAALQSDWFPFCSQRCRQVDLLRWTEGTYQIADPLTPDQLEEHLQNDPAAFDELGESDDLSPGW